MAATDSQITVAAARWTEEGSYLREYVSKHRLPAVVKIIKGQYGGLGVPTLPSPGLQSTALLVSAGSRHKIVAQPVKIKEGRRLVCVGPRLAIPETYPGYFELLSEEGRAVRCIESVQELARRRPEEGCLVREAIRGIQAKTDLDGILIAEGARTLSAGEVIAPSPGGEVSLSGCRGRYLRCTDGRGALVLLGLEQRGKFSAIARGDDSISGVHTAKNLLGKRLPLTVRLVHGEQPKGAKSNSHFVPELRLLSIFQEEHVFALPLQKDTNTVTSLPSQAPLKLLRSRNDEQLRGMAEFSRLVEKCTRLVSEVADRIQVLDGKLGDSKKSPSQEPKSAGYLLRRSSSSDSAAHRSIGLPRPGRKDENRVPVLTKDYEEIDQIYDYVRGFAPLPKHIRSPFSDSTVSSLPPAIPLELKPPEPPPIETIPTKKSQAEKRNRKGGTSTIREHGPPPIVDIPLHQDKLPPGLPKLYIKNNHTQRSRLFRQKSASPMKETPPISKSGSPIFNIRYKSLNNLQQAMELDGTLDSSNSGGRASGDSGGGAKQPEKRCRKLSRPRSLSNLVWEMKEFPDISMIPPDKPSKQSAQPQVPPSGGVAYGGKKHMKHLVKRGALYL